MNLSSMTLRAFVLAFAAAAALLLACLVSANPAAAQTCTATTAPASYGTVNVLSGTTTSTVASFSVTCSGTAGQTVRLCIEFGPGNNFGGVTTSRSLVGATTGLTHEIYTNAAHTTIWGSWGLAIVAYKTGGLQYDLAIPASGTATATLNAYGLISANQSTVPPGTYTWTTGSPGLGYAYRTTASCPLTTTRTYNTGAGATVWTATVQSYCSVSSATLNFGSTGILSAAKTASSPLLTTCTNGTPYAIALDGGQTGASDPTHRAMSKGSEFVYYGLYKDSALSQPWGTAAGTTASSTGSGAAQSLPVYGNVPIQATPSPGTYSDTVVVTLTY